MLEGPAKPPLQHILLSQQLPLEAADLAPERDDIRLRPGDPTIERRHLFALLGQPAVDDLDLCQEAGLSLARVRRLGALIVESPLRLLEVALLVSEIGPLLLLAAGRRRQRGEGEHETKRSEKQTAHEARPLASRPPIAPRVAPPAMTSSIWGGDRKTARCSPSVSGNNGSSRGAATAYAASST